MSISVTPIPRGLSALSYDIHNNGDIQLCGKYIETYGILMSSFSYLVWV